MLPHADLKKPAAGMEPRQWTGSQAPLGLGQGMARHVVRAVVSLSCLAGPILFQAADVDGCLTHPRPLVFVSSNRLVGQPAHPAP